MSDDRIQKVFDLKELNIKMSVVLNVSNDSYKPQEFSMKDIEMLVDSEEQNWFKRAHVGKFLGIEDIRTSLNGLEKCEMLTRQELVPNRRDTPAWPEPRYQPNKMNKFLLLFGVMYTTVNSKKDKGKVLKKLILKDIVRRGFDTRIEKIQEKHRQANEEKDAAIALLKITEKILTTKYRPFSMKTWHCKHKGMLSLTGSSCRRSR